MKPVDIVTSNHKRNPWRVLPIEKAESEALDFFDKRHGESKYMGNDAASDISSNND